MNYIISLALTIGAYYLVIFLIKRNKKNQQQKLEEKLHQEFMNEFNLFSENQNLIRQKILDLCIKNGINDMEKQIMEKTDLQLFAEDILTKEKNGINTGADLELITLLRNTYPEFK